MKYLFTITYLFVLGSILFFWGCQDQGSFPNIDPDETSNLVVDSIWRQYKLMPEKVTTSTSDSLWLATYINPTERYQHAVLGDRIEAGAVVLYHDDAYYEYYLPSDAVFEDIAPRLIEVTGDSIPEVLCIRSEVSAGAGLVIYQVQGPVLKEYAFVAPIGTPNRWLNVVAVKDLDQNGTIELAWIQTPHIGGILKVAEIEAGEMTVLDEYSGVSNHGLGERNLCLSALVEEGNQIQIVVPAQARDQAFYFKFEDGVLTKEREEEQSIDFSLPIYGQLEMTNFVSDNNCMGER